MQEIQQRKARHIGTKAQLVTRDPPVADARWTPIADNPCEDQRDQTGRYDLRDQRPNAGTGFPREKHADRQTNGLACKSDQLKRQPAHRAGQQRIMLCRGCGQRDRYCHPDDNPRYTRIVIKQRGQRRDRGGQKHQDQAHANIDE